jgi:hypothetical protein
MPIIATYNEDQPTEIEKQLLMSLVFISDMDEEEKEDTMQRIVNCTDYKEFTRLQYLLEVRQQTINNIPNPSQADISRHILKIVR